MAEQMEQQPEAFHAVQLGDIATLKKYMDEGVPVDLTDEDGWSLLHHAAALSRVEVIILLRENGCPVDLIDNKGRTPLHYAAINGDIETIKILIAMGSNVNSVDNDGTTPLKWSVMCGRNTAIVELTEHGGTVDIEEMEPSADKLDRPALPFPFQDPGHILGDGNNEVCQSNQTELTTDIQHVSTSTVSNDSYKHSDHNGHQTDLVTTNQCMDTNAATTQLEGDIFEAAQCGDTATVKGYLDLDVLVDVTDEDGWSPVHHAIAHRQVEVIKLLIDRECLMNPVKDRKQATKNSDGQNTIKGGSKYSTYDKKQLYEYVFEAARYGDSATIQSYLNSGGPVDLTDEDGQTLLHCAAGEGQIKVVEVLIKRGCRIDPVNNIGWTPSIYATARGHVQTARLLIDKQQLNEPQEEQNSTDRMDRRGRSILHVAATFGDIHLIEMLAKQGLDVNIGDDEGLTPLHYAATSGQLESVRTLLRLGGRKSMTKVAGVIGTPLHQAVVKGHKDIVSLLNEGCPINVVDSGGRSVLHYAANCGQIQMIELLAEQELGVNIGDDEGWTPLHYAAAYGQLETVRTLLRLGGRESMIKVAGTGEYPLHLAVAKGHKDIVSLLLNKGCSINVVDSEGRNVLHYAARYGQIHLIEMLAEQGLDVKLGDDEGLTPLHVATLGQLESVCTLLRLGGTASMTKVAGTCGTPLHQAIAKGHKDIVSLLLNEGCPINVVDSRGKSVLHYASQCGQIPMIEMLVGQKLDVNIGDAEGWTPLHDAAACGQLESLHALLRLGGRESVSKVAGTDGTPLHQAVVKGHKDIVSLLLNESCPIDVVNSEGRSVLHYAAQYGQIHMMKMLAEQGLDVNVGDAEGWTPFHDAAVYGQLESVHTLLRLGGRTSMTKVAGRYGTPLHQAVGKGHKDIVSLLLKEGCPINVVDSEGRSVLHIATQYSCNEATFKELVDFGGNIHLSDNFGMKFTDLILISHNNFVIMKQICLACGLECRDESPLGVISALSANNLLDMNRILCLAAVLGNISIFDAMVSSSYPLNEQKMPKIAILLSLEPGGKKLLDQFHVSEEPLNPLHISIIQNFLFISEDSDLRFLSQNIKFIEKLTSHPRTRYTVNELFPNGLSPLDVARRFELQDIAVIIERAGGGPGAWDDLPKEIEDKAIDIFMSLKELRGMELGGDVTSRIVSMLGYPLVISDQQEVKILEETPKRSLIEKHVLPTLKYKRKWERVGNLLEVDEDIMENIGEEATDDDDAYYSVLKHWLKHGHNVSWKTLLEAVGHFETKKTVDYITDKIVEELAPSQVSIQI